MDERDGELERRADLLEARRRRKREATRRYKARRDREDAVVQSGAGRLVERLRSLGVWEALEEEHRGFLMQLMDGGSVRRVLDPELVRMFGKEPSLGDRVTLREAFGRTLMGKDGLDRLARKVRDDGVVLRFDYGEGSVLDGTYTVTGLWGAKADV